MVFLLFDTKNEISKPWHISGTPFNAKVPGRNQEVCLKLKILDRLGLFRLTLFSCQGEQVQLDPISDFDPSGVGLHQDRDPGLRISWHPRHPRRSEVVRSKHCHRRGHCWHRQDHGQGGSFFHHCWNLYHKWSSSARCANNCFFIPCHQRCYLPWRNSSQSRFWLPAFCESEARCILECKLTYLPTYLTCQPRCGATCPTTLGSRCPTSCWSVTRSTSTNTFETSCTSAFSQRKASKDSQQESEPMSKANAINLSTC